MFPPLTTTSRLKRRSPLGALVRGAVDAALEFATLGEATAAGPAEAPPAGAPGSRHPHRRRLARSVRARRDGAVPPRAQVCLTPVHRPAGRA